MNFENRVERLPQWWDAQAVKTRLAVLEKANMYGVTALWEWLPPRQQAELWQLAKVGRLPVFQV